MDAEAFSEYDSFLPDESPVMASLQPLEFSNDVTNHAYTDNNATTATIPTTTTTTTTTNNNNNNNNNNGLNYRWFPSIRFLTVCLLCMCFVSIHVMNSNMGMAMVCMVDTNNNNSRSQQNENILNATIGRKLDWSQGEQGMVFGAFNVGLLFMLGTGYVADKVNAKYMLIASVALAATANVIIAVASRWSFLYATFGRFMVGLADAVLQPVVNSLLTRWFPLKERSHALGIATGGRQIGTLLILPIAGVLCSRSILGGWPAIFFFSAISGVLFAVVWLLLGADKPSKHRCISDGEKKYIEGSLWEEAHDEKRKHRTVPWRCLLTSGPVWAAVISMVCHEFPLITMIMFLPSYLNDVLGFEPQDNGFLSALPTLCLWISKVASSYLSAFLQRRTRFTHTTIVKILNGVGSLGLGCFLAATCLLDRSNPGWAVALLCCSMASAGLHTPGCMTALVSIAPIYSGTITGLTFFFVACSGVINPLLTKWLTPTGAQREWNTVFLISAGVALIPLIVFNVWGSADVQLWARSKASVAAYLSRQGGVVGTDKKFSSNSNGKNGSAATTTAVNNHVNNVNNVNNANRAKTISEYVDSGIMRNDDKKGDEHSEVNNNDIAPVNSVVKFNLASDPADSDRS